MRVYATFLHRPTRILRCIHTVATAHQDDIMQSYGRVPFIPFRALSFYQQSALTTARKQTFLRRYSDKTPTTVPPRGPVLTQSPSPPRQDIVGAGVHRPQIEGKGGGIAPHLLVFLGCLMATPPIIYYYWQYRDQHMREKKEGMLREIQARAARTA